MKRTIAIISMALALSGCGTVGRLKQVGRAPATSPMDEYAMPSYEPSIARADAMAGGMVPTHTPGVATASLFRDGAGELFQDQRATHVGDILTINVHISDRAIVDNSTTRSRVGSETAGIASLLGLGGVPGLDTDLGSKSSSNGSGNTSRSEQIDMTVAAIVTGVLPNGNLVIRGRQEIRVNFELREFIITGIVRPQDVERDNTIAHSKIAEARIIYGGRGQLTDVQQARWGQQIFEALFPF